MFLVYTGESFEALVEEFLGGQTLEPVLPGSSLSYKLVVGRNKTFSPTTQSGSVPSIRQKG